MRKVTAVALCALTLSAQASIKGVVGLTFGWDWARVGKDQKVLLVSTDPYPDSFVEKSTYSNQPMGGVSAGIEFPIWQNAARWQTTLAYYISNTFETNGIDYFYSIPTLGNKKYQFSLMNQRAMFENKVLFALDEVLYDYPGFYFYLMLGIGLAFNNAYDYHETSIDPTTPPPDTYFADNSTTSPTYSAGLGIEAELAETLRLGLGYRFSDFGQVSLGDYNYGDTGNTLTNNNVLVNEMILELTVVF